MATGQIDRSILNIAQNYANIIATELPLHGLYLYGSYVKGTAHADSDIDIAVIADGFTGDLIDDTMRLMRLRRSIDTRIEPRPFLTSEFNVHNPFAQEILLTGFKVV